MSIQVIITVLVIIAIFAYIAFLALTKRWTKLREMAYAMMLQAERVYLDEQGKEKFEAVFSRMYEDYLPNWIKAFVPETILREYLQDWYNKAKDYLDNGALDNSTPG